MGYDWNTYIQETTKKSAEGKHGTHQTCKNPQKQGGDHNPDQ